MQRRLIEPNVIEHHVVRQERKEAVVDPYVLQRHHLLAVHRDVDIFHLDAEEQIAVDAADAQTPVHVIVSLPDDEAAQPFLEPGGLRHDDRHRRDADDQRADERDDLQKLSCDRHDPKPLEPPLERLTNAEVNAPRARLRLAVHLQVRNAIQLIPEVDTRWTDRREISQTWSHGVQETRRDVDGPVRHVPEIEERDASELAEERFADFGRSLHHRQPADRKAETAQRADFEATPPTDARCPTEEITLEEGHTGLATKCVYSARVNAVRPDEGPTDAHVLARFAAHLPVVVRAPQPLACLFDVSRQHIALIGVEQVVRRVVIHV